MGKTSTAVKARWNAQHYDQIKLQVKKGYKDKYRAYAQSKGVSLTKLICDLVEKDMKAAGFAAPDGAEQEENENAE